jgi:large subunit ribosomal protein L35
MPKGIPAKLGESLVLRKVVGSKSTTTSEELITRYFYKCLGAIKVANSLQTPHEHNEKGAEMPKMKTKSGAKKRFRVRPGGTVKRGQAFKRHILTKKTTKNKRHLRGSTAVHETNMGHMAQMLPGRGI